MDTFYKICKMTSTQVQRDELENLTCDEKLKLVLELTDSKTFIEILEFIQQANEDSEYCRSYR